MLWIGDKKVGRLYIGSKAVEALYIGAVKVWTAVSSCFGAGYWRGILPWNGSDAWKTN